MKNFLRRATIRDKLPEWTKIKDPKQRRLAQIRAKLDAPTSLKEVDILRLEPEGPKN